MTAENQIRGAKEFAKSGLMNYVGNVRDFGTVFLAEKALEMVIKYLRFNELLDTVKVNNGAMNIFRKNKRNS